MQRIIVPNHMIARNLLTHLIVRIEFLIKNFISYKKRKLVLNDVKYGNIKYI
jgi:hypothetical protein